MSRGGREGMKTLLYAPMIYRQDKGMWPPTTPSCLYFRWQRALLFALGSLARWRVIWKAGPRTSNLQDPIPTIIANHPDIRVRYSTRKISRELKNADLCLVDHPSTPILDADKAGAPWFCIMPWDHKKVDWNFANLKNVSLVSCDEGFDNAWIILRSYLLDFENGKFPDPKPSGIYVHSSRWERRLLER